jgi:hypothetical protein
MDERTAPVIVMLAMSAAAIAIVALVMRHKRQMREMLSRERLAALDKGVEIPWEMDFRRPSRARRLHLKSGVILLGAGLGLTLVSTLQGNWGERRDVLTWALFLLVMGATSVLYDRYVGRAEWERTMAMDEALTRAYIRRLEGVAALAHGVGAQDGRNGA